MRISDWSSDVCSSDLLGTRALVALVLVVRLERHGIAPDCGHKRRARRLKAKGGTRCPVPPPTKRRDGSDRLQILRRGLAALRVALLLEGTLLDRTSTRLNSSH